MNDEKINIGDKEKILNLRDGESYTIPEVGAEIWFKNNTYVLFEIPQCLSEKARFMCYYNKNQVDILIEEYASWTKKGGKKQC